jgi:hypothetical protein
MYQKWHKDGLEVIGINLDPKVETGQEVCKTLGLTYPQAWIPSDKKTRELWQTASGIEGDPRVLLIDRDGTIVDDNPNDMEQQVARLMKDGQEKKE